MQKSIRLSIFLISFLFLFSIHVPLYACWSPGPGDFYYQYHFFQYESHSHSSDHPSPLGSINHESANLKEWMNYFNNTSNIDDIKQIIYPAISRYDKAEELQAYLDKLGNIKEYINGKSVDIDEEHSSNTLIAYLKNNNDTEFINYLIEIFKWRLPLIKNWADDEKFNSEVKIDDVNMWIDAFTMMHSKSSSSFYKTRYAYQMVRIARYAKQYSRAISIYDEYLKPIATNSIIKYWALEHVAGAYHHKGKALLGSGWNPTEDPDSILSGQNDIAKANYLFAQVYDKCPSRRGSSLLSLKIETDGDWDRVVKLCNNNKEIVNLVAMRATSPKSNLFEEMEAIYDLDPTSVHLEMLMKKEFFNIEHQLLLKNFEYNIFISRDKVSIDKKQIIDIINGLLVFTEKCINNQLITNNEFWMLANGYLNILSGNFKEANTMFNDIKKKNPNSDVVDQIDVFELLTDIITIDQIGNKIEDDLFIRAKTLDNIYLSELLIKVFGSLYEKQGLSTKAFLCNNSHLGNRQTTSRFENKDYAVFNALVKDYNVELMEKIIEFINKKDKTEFERFLATSTLNKRVSYEAKPFTKNDLLPILGTIAMKDYRLDDAIMYWEQMSDKSSLGLTRNPFEVKLLDDVCDCDWCWCRTYDKEKNGYVYTGPEKNYNKLEIAKELKNLIQSINTPSWTTIQPETFYKIGNYYLNSTYFGHSWEMHATSRSGWFSAKYHKDSKRHHLDFKTPMKYYDQCIELSKGNNNELAAECTFMAAKCEQFQYISEPDSQETTKGRWGYDLVFPNYDVYGKYFTILKNDFSDTKYYEQAIKECKYFNYFVTKDEK